MQVVIFIVQNIEGDRSELNRISEFFFKSFEIDEVREFEIKDKLGNVQFKKTGKNWFLSQNGDRVSSEKIKKFFINLKDITKFRPGIVSKTLHSNFMVGDDNYSKMITLTGSETLVLFLEERIKLTEVICESKATKRSMKLILFSIISLLNQNYGWS